MGESNIQANNDDLLQSLDQDFDALQRHFAEQLAQDIEYLKTEKSRLLDAIATLRQEYDDLELRYQTLQATAEVALSQQQLAQQQAWAKRLAQVLAKDLRDDLHSYVLNASDQDFPNPAKDWMSSLDETLSHTVQALQNDLSSYQSAMAQQLSRMQTMEQQGEVILDSLVQRLSQQLQIHQAQAQGMGLTPGLSNAPLGEQDNAFVERSRLGTPSLPMEPARRLIPPYPGKTLSASQSRAQLPKANAKRQAARTKDHRVALPRAHALKKGFILSAIATVMLAFHTVLVGAISWGGTLFSLNFSGLDAFHFQNANALLWLRMLVFLPILLILAPQLHRTVWSDLQGWSRKRNVLLSLVGSGCFLFFSQVFLYQAVGQLGPAMAAGLLFIYPLIAIPLTWLVNGERPSLLRGVVMGAIVMGSVLLIRPAFLELGDIIAQAGAGLLAAIAFGLYIVTMNLSLHRHCHPISAGIVQFSTVTLLSSLILLVSPAGFTQDVISPWQFALGGISLGILATIAYFFNYVGLRLVGGSRAALIAAATPIITAVIAIWGFNNQPTLQIMQWTGLMCITLGSLTLGLDRLKRKA